MVDNAVKTAGLNIKKVAQRHQYQSTIASVLGLLLRTGAIGSAVTAAYGAFTDDHHLDRVASYFVLVFLVVELILGNTAE